MLGEERASEFLQCLVAENANSVSELAEAVSDAPTGTEIQKLARTALETDFSPYLIAEKNYNEVLSKSRRKRNFKSLDDDQQFQELK